jgi:hypothetical protein
MISRRRVHRSGVCILESTKEQTSAIEDGDTQSNIIYGPELTLGWISIDSHISILKMAGCFRFV